MTLRLSFILEYFDCHTVTTLIFSATMSPHLSKLCLLNMAYPPSALEILHRTRPATSRSANIYVKILNSLI